MFCLQICLIALIVFASNLYLQWCQNELSTYLMTQFAFSWHTEKFLLSCFVLLVVCLFMISLSGSIWSGLLFYSVSILVLGFADYQKMYYRSEPIYPDDFKMITEFSLLREMAGNVAFVLIVLVVIIAILFFGIAVYRSRKLSKNQQKARLSVLVLTFISLLYISNFNDPNNLLRKAYNRSATWIPYSQKMNYYNTGFVAGFLYNLKVEAMDKPENYSKQTIQSITEKYQQQVKTDTQNDLEEQPNIVFVMSESFSNPQALTGVSADKNPLELYDKIADQTYSGKMLSQNYGGGTANIEFEALTSFSMELFNSQMTTPYTMLVPKLNEVPSIVSLLNGQNYQTTAIHPYNTSMYKRKSVYETFGFDQFISESEMSNTSKIEKNTYISDEAAYEEVWNLLEQKEQAQFVHLVTMQTHMPYKGKYNTLNYSSESKGNKQSIDSYMQDIAYSSQAFSEFIAKINQLERRTLVVFWGDHLPSIYSDEIKADNEEVVMHQTEFLMYDNQGKLKNSNQHDVMTSPFYFAPTLFQQSELATTGFYQLLNQLSQVMPAFEKGFYYVDNKWQSEISLSAQQNELYEDYYLIQYDIFSGEQYSLQTDFFTE